ncbi:DUF4160 domain-containing protein [Chromatium okenii]|uniref:DUF4160 domain-containing protein n=1 Tax=Chromatium okenii TaxID=61644 RepID=UPI0026F2BEE8|nr:DUF4160 domain-containing protein [Chromatium okenii]MBV5310670.1 DUF4160 domain-containing protein [Chromatium okenii]
MPTISMFYGILIQMFFREHSPPHVHVKYGDYKAVIAINPPELTEGKLPRRALRGCLKTKFLILMLKILT